MGPLNGPKLADTPPPPKKEAGLKTFNSSCGSTIAVLIGQLTQMDDISKVTDRERPNFNVSKDSENTLKVTF